MWTSLNVALFAAAVLGFRHGLDYDHIAAISDIASVESSPRRAMKLAPLYAFGHWTTIAVLGLGAIYFQKSLPHSLDRWSERIVGTTLILFGLYVLASLFRKGESYIPKARWTLLIQAFRTVVWRLRNRSRAVQTARPESKVWKYDGRSVFVLGLLHGLGAETPSQLALFALAANLGGVAKGFLALGMFFVGLLLMNTLMMASASGIFGASTSRPGVLRLATAVTAAYSLAIGTILLTGTSSFLPQIG